MVFVAIEGFDGAGKTEVARRLAEQLGYREISFPNDQSYTGPMIRSYLRREWFIESKTPYPCPGPLAGPMAFQALMVANRMEVMPLLEEAALEYEPKVVAARYWQSGWVYGQIDGLDPAWLRSIHATMAQPNLNILLDIDVQQALERRAARDGKKAAERYENSETAELAVALYRKLWEQEGQSSPDDVSWVVVDARQPLEDVVRLVVGIVRAFL